MNPALIYIIEDEPSIADGVNLYLRRAELAETPESAATYRLALARLFKKEIGDEDGGDKRDQPPGA